MEKQSAAQERTAEEKLRLYHELMKRALSGEKLDLTAISPGDVGPEGRQAIVAVVRRGRRNGGDLYL